MFCCISFVFYIKPQQEGGRYEMRPVVYLLFSTSNHNWLRSGAGGIRVVYLLFSTSNHNKQDKAFLVI